MKLTVDPKNVSFEITNSWISWITYFLNHNWFSSKTNLIKKVTNEINSGKYLKAFSDVMNQKVLKNGMRTIPLKEFQANINVVPIQDPIVKKNGLIMYSSGFVFSQKTKNSNIGQCKPMRHAIDFENYENDAIFQIGECPILGMFNAMIQNKWTRQFPLSKPGKFDGSVSISF